MEILYILLDVSIWLIGMLLPKKQRKANLIQASVLCLLVWMSYHTFLCYIYNLCQIPITLANLTIVNVLVCIVGMGVLWKKKKIQAYQLDKQDIVVSIIFLCITFVMLYINFGTMDKLKYVSMDAIEHYKAAREFSENTVLADKATYNNTTYPHFMPMAYTNVGLLFKVFKPWIGTVNVYPVYIAWEATIFFLTMLSFYFLCKKKKQANHSGVLIVLFTILYGVGYPLNSWISGFHYLGLSLWVIFSILIVLQEQNRQVQEKECIENPEENKKNFYVMVILFFYNIALLFSYCLFAPIVYIVELLYFLRRKRQRLDTTKQFMINIGVLLGITGIIGVTYLLIPQILDVHTTGLERDGSIYKNLWSNFILFVPFALYSFYRYRKEKTNISNIHIALIVTLIYMLILWIAKQYQICSAYYFYKNAYILWGLLIACHCEGMCLFRQKGQNGKYITNLYTICYIGLCLFSIWQRPSYLVYDTYAKEDITTTMDIYSFNKTMITSQVRNLDRGQLAILTYLEKEMQIPWKEAQKDLLFIAENSQTTWIRSLTGFEDEGRENLEQAIIRCTNRQYTYVVCFYESEIYKAIGKNLGLEEETCIYQNEAGCIYQIL